MFNEELCKIYDERTIKELRAWAVTMEAQNRRVSLALPADLVPGMVFPKAVGIEDFQDSDLDTVDAMYVKITEGRPFIEYDGEYMYPCRRSTVDVVGGGLELWVK